MKRIISQIILLILAVMSFPVFSANFGFMYDTPAQFFTDSDWKMLEATADKALNALANGKKLQWINPKTGNGGTLEPLNLIKKHGTVCRDLQMTNRAHHQTDQYVFTFCKFNAGWKIPNKSV